MASEPTDQRERIEERATAFVFGEMDRDEATEFMKAVDASPELQSTVASIREAVGALQFEFEDETAGVQETDRQKIAVAIRKSDVEAPPVTRPDSEFSPRQWPTGLAVAATLLLACGLTFPALNRVITANTETKELQEEIRRIELLNEELVAEKLEAEQKLASLLTRSPALNSADTNPDQSGDKNTVNQVNDVADAGSMDATDGQAESDLPDTQRVDGGGPGGANASVADSSPSAVSPSAVSPSAVSPSAVSPSAVSPSAVVTTDDSATPGTPQLADLRTPAPRDDRPARIILGGSQSGMPPLLGQRFPVRPGSVIPRNPQPEIGEFSGGDNVMKEIMEGAKATLELMFGAGLTGHHHRDPSRPTFDGGNPNAKPLSLDELATRLIDEHQIHPISDNPFVPVVQSPLSVFPMDVQTYAQTDAQTAAYDRMRTSLSKHDHLPLPRSVRIEEWINYFDYNYAPPTDGRPFAATLDVAECPWNPEHRLARIGIKGRVVDGDRPSSNLVFLVDVSGSMNQPSKLPAVVAGLKRLIGQLRENDTLAMVAYAGANGVVLDATPGDEKRAMVEAIGRLKSGGPTASVKGIELAFKIARDHHLDAGINRVIVCSDGNRNLGLAENSQLAKLIETNAEEGTFLTVLGFGADKQRDPVIDQIIRDSQGSVAFIDNDEGAANVLVRQIHGDLATIANDVKARVEFNPMKVDAYRLIGYENRVFSPGELNDAGAVVGSEFESGQAVTALYELIPKSEVDGAKTVEDPNPADDMKYQIRVRYSDQASSGEWMTVKLRYKLPTADGSVDQRSDEMEFVAQDGVRRLDHTDRDFQFAASIAAFGMLLRQSPHMGDANYEMVQELASAGAVDDPSGYRQEFQTLVKRAARLADNKVEQ